LESQLQELRSEHYNLVKENKENSEKLSKELQNSVNAHYLKNILFSYLTTQDQTVRSTLTP